MKKLLLAVAIAATTFAIVHHRGRPNPSDLAFDRIWIDHMPRGERDMVEVFIAFDEHPFGQFIATSRWAGNFEGFKYDGVNGELRIVFPQSGKKERMLLEPKACDAPGFDYCLEIKGSSHGAKRYYSQEDWVIDPNANVDARVHAILAP